MNNPKEFEFRTFSPPISYNYPLTFYAVSNKFITFVP